MTAGVDAALVFCGVQDMPQGSIFEIPRRHDNRVVIAHISDLHFKQSQAKYKVGEVHGEHLVELIDGLERLKPDFIAFTGDVTNDPDRATFQSAMAFVEDLRKTVNINDNCLAVIPGNHDLVRSGTLPSFGFALRKRLKWFDDAFARWIAPYREIHYSPPSSAGQCFHMKIGCLNSNSDSWDLNLAGGRVIPVRLKKFRDDMGAPEGLEPFTMRVALVHHHLLPIAEAQVVGTSGLEKEQFHLLMNAGVVMRAMMSCGVELVLHGHRHYGGFARITYPAYAYRFNTKLDNRLRDFLGDASHRTISVIGAGSCGKPEKPTGPYQFNVVNLFLDGSVRVDEFERDSQEAYHERTPGGIAVSNGAAALATHYRWLLATKLASKTPPIARARSVRYSILVSEHGDGYGRREVRGFRALDGKLEKFPFLVFSDSGYLSDQHKPKVTSSTPARSIRWEKDYAAAQASIPTAMVGEPNITGFPGNLHFDPLLGPEEHDEVDYAVSTLVPNAFRSHLGIHPDRPDEHIGFRVGPSLIEQLVVSLRFHDPKVGVALKVMTSVTDAGGNEDLTEAQRISLHTWDGEYSYTVQRPLPGYRYGLKWRLPTINEYEVSRYGELKPEDRKLAADGVAKMLGADVRSEVGGLLGVVKVELCHLMNVLLGTVWESITNVPEKEFEVDPSGIDLSFQVVDKATDHLQLVAATRPILSTTWNMYYGQGICGLALRRGQAVFHDNQVDEGPPHYLPRKDVAGLVTHAWLFSIPIGFNSLGSMPGSSSSVRWPVGVFNISAFDAGPVSRWFFSGKQLPGTNKEIGGTLQNALLDRIYASDGFAGRLRGILA